MHEKHYLLYTMSELIYCTEHIRVNVINILHHVSKIYLLMNNYYEQVCILVISIQGVSVQGDVSNGASDHGSLYPGGGPCEQNDTKNITLPPIIVYGQ